ncbi:MAG: S8 family serine peptidase, partial [Chloroflexota bacterium]|nr:S8 family serine peptidase [Chloroflexota bacterium]
MPTPTKRLLRLLLIVTAILVLALPAGIGAQDDATALDPLRPAPSSETGALTDETAQLWFVELASPPTADGTSLTTVRAEKNAFRNAAGRAGVRFDERFAYDTLFNGLAVRVEPAQLGALARVTGVKALYPIVEMTRPVVEDASDPDMGTAIAMTGADVAGSELGLSGAGVRVAVMDTGIDYQHPDLGGCFGSGCRVAVGYDFVGDAFNADSSSPAYNPKPVPDEHPDDCGGHGTHVAGIVGANGAVKGVAPDVTFGAYRVFGCEGSTTADIMIAAMERTLADGMQVLNMSIGSAFQWPQYPTAMASNRMVNKGMVVVASIGNSGANGAYAAGAPGLGEKVIGVASFDNSHVSLSTFTISPDDKPIGYAPATAAPAPPTSGSLPMAKTGTPITANDACNPLPAGSLAGKVVLIRRGTCPFYQKARNAQNAGAAAVVLYNNSPGRFGATVAGSPAVTIPVVAISDAEGVLINNRLNAGPVELTWTDQTGRFVNATGGLISSFSSYGLSPDLTLKPDIGAPGGLIYSTYPLEKGGYATLSGTSMSSPHTAGGVALLLQARPRTSAQAVRTILQNSADPKPWWGNPALGLLDNVHRQGTGMLDIDDAILATTRIEPGKLSLGESEAGPATRTLTIANDGNSAITYDLSHAGALSTTGNTFTPSFNTGFAAVAFTIDGVGVSSVTVPAGGTATVTATITANSALPDRSQYGGYLVFTPRDGGEPYRVPYAGFKGDYQSIVALTPTPCSLPWLAKKVASSVTTPCKDAAGKTVGSITGYTNEASGATYTLKDGDLPYVLVHLDHQVRRLRMEVLDADTGVSFHRAFEQEYVGRNSTSTGFNAYAWD